jgi:hypothetical protein
LQHWVFIPERGLQKVHGIVLIPYRLATNFSAQKFSHNFESILKQMYNHTFIAGFPEVFMENK